MAYINGFKILFSTKIITTSGGIIPSGTLPITENGTYDVTDKASVAVNVEAALIEKEILSNGEYYASADGADGFSSVFVNVPITEDSALPIEVATEEEMTAILTNATSDDLGAVYQYTGETTDTYEKYALYYLGHDTGGQ